MRDSIAIDGNGIKLMQIRAFRSCEHLFGAFEVFIFVPEPQLHGSAEAFVSARQKERAFSAAGFRCTICRVGDSSIDRAFRMISSGCGFFVVQRPLDPKSLALDESWQPFNLDSCCEKSGLSAITETVCRILAPFIAKRRSADSVRPVNVGVLGCRGFFGREISTKLGGDGVVIHGIDVGDDRSAILDTDIVVSAIGLPHVIAAAELGVHKDVLVDIGYSYNEADGRSYGDFHPSCFALCDFYTPVPGGVGPLQVLTIIERAVRLAGHNSYRPWHLPSFTD